MKKRVLQVTLHARESSVVELTVAERVQLDRITRSPRGNVATRHGALLEPGAHTLALADGHYFFRTLSDANLRVVRGGVATSIVPQDKGEWPDPPADTPAVRGDDGPCELPTLTVE